MKAERLQRLVLFCIGALVLQAIYSAVVSRAPSASITVITGILLLAFVYFWFHELAAENRRDGESLGQKRTAVVQRPAACGDPPQLPVWWRDMKHRLPHRVRASQRR